MPNIPYDAPYLSEAEHAELDHSDVPGIGGGSGGGFITDSYGYFNQAPITVEAASGLTPGVLAELVNTTAGAVTLGPDPETVTVNEEGVYSVIITSQWNCTEIETGSREINFVVGVGGGNIATAAAFNQLKVRSLIGGLLVDNDNHLIQHASAVGFISAGTTFDFKYLNGDNLNTSDLASFSASLIKLS